MCELLGAERLVERTDSTSQPGRLTFCNSVIGAHDSVTGTLAHALLIAMFPDATDITELSADEVHEWEETLSELIEHDPRLTYPAGRLVIDVGDYWITKSTPQSRKAAPPVAGGYPDPASADRSQLAQATKPLAGITWDAASVELLCEHQMSAGMASLAICSK